jgi:Xaa-Pro aminopeptidase
MQRLSTAAGEAARDALIAGRLAALREAMARHGVDAYLVPSVDEHLNEYLPDNRQRRAWLTGFTGSAGDCLAASKKVGAGEAWLFVDSRYHEQAEQEVSPGLIQLGRLGQPDAPTLEEKLREWASGFAVAQKRPFRLGFDPATLTVRQAEAFRQMLGEERLSLVAISGNLIDALWQNAPSTPRSPVFSLPENVTGRSAIDKLAAVRERLDALKAEVLPVTRLDQVAWLLNLRGADIPYNPVFLAYAVISSEGLDLFVDDSRLASDARTVLDALGGAVTLRVHPYADYARILPERAKNRTVLVDARHTTQLTLDLITQGGGTVRRSDQHPVERLKAVKNEAEIRAMQMANLRASRGKVRAWHWLEVELAAGHAVTEAGFRDAIEAFYAEEDDFAGLSFNTISGAGANGSIVHYGTPDPDKRLEPGELFLIDSGCQFRIGGTTDDTRTLLVGECPTDVQRFRYTEVLKAHVNVAMQRFPAGTEGARLDGIARATLWQNGLDYGHGTGHGVGAFLNVHEGPNGIHKLAATPLEPGMITSIEPGFYESGWGGIRLENLYRVVPVEDAARPVDKAKHSVWLGFESLTWIPFDKKLVDFTRLSPEQRQWLRDYHRTILEKLASTLSVSEADWLRVVCEW